jgi:hypothetical protein
MYTTFNYEQCKELKTQNDAIRASDDENNYINREVNQTHVNKIKASMPGCLPNLPAILINVENNHILDGQHRVTAFLQSIDEGNTPENAELSVKLIKVTAEREREIIRECNVYVSPWNSRNYLTHAENMNRDVSKIIAFAGDKTRLLTGSGRPKVTLCCLYVKGETDKIIKSAESLANLTVTDEELEFAETLYNETSEIFDIIQADAKIQETSFISVWRTMRSSFPFEAWITGFKKFKNDFIRNKPRKKYDWELYIGKVELWLTRQ